MPKFTATKFKLADARAGLTKITFYDVAGVAFEIELPTIAIMGLAHGLRLRAKQATVPVAQLGLSQTRHLRGPHVKTLDISSRPIGKNGGFDVGVTADFDHVVVAFHAPGESEGAKAMPVMLAQGDATDLLKSIQLALETIRQKPSPTAH